MEDGGLGGESWSCAGVARRAWGGEGRSEERGELTLAPRSVVGGAFCISFVTWGYVNAFGVYQAHYQLNQLSEKAPADISWIGSVQLAMVSSSLRGAPAYEILRRFLGAGLRYSIGQGLRCRIYQVSPCIRNGDLHRKVRLPLSLLALRKLTPPAQLVRSLLCIKLRRNIYCPRRWLRSAFFPPRSLLLPPTKRPSHTARSRHHLRPRHLLHLAPFLNPSRDGSRHRSMRQFDWWSRLPAPPQQAIQLERRIRLGCTSLYVFPSCASVAELTEAQLRF